ncbi:MAG: hypothetical protein LCH32_02645 [Bacteroidetes bacterium]|uniref:hypothetical protein n=1 Tax=Flavobacterium filum TaxID=370974 RepID=UPI0023F512E5|nr:hypothetical protein [Flavobacterium filum]MCA0429381.1 hypothetical protein [Bacteroidota bacterium]
MDMSLTKIALEYALSNLDNGVVNTIIQNELGTEEKIEILKALPDERIKKILQMLGFKSDFLNTI